MGRESARCCLMSVLQTSEQHPIIVWARCDDSRSPGDLIEGVLPAPCPQRIDTITCFSTDTVASHFYVALVDPNNNSRETWHFTVPAGAGRPNNPVVFTLAQALPVGWAARIGVVDARSAGTVVDFLFGG